HPRKPQQTNARIDLSEVAGSADLGRKADNVLFVKRDFDTEDQSAVGDCRRMKVQVAKQRHGSGFLGEIDGWFHMKLRQFVPDPGQNYPTAYLPKPAYGRIRG